VTETVACSDGGAYFASSIMGMAAMESILMLACVAEKSRVLTTHAWTSFHQKRRMTFSQRLAHVDLSKLLEIGHELKWFPETHLGIEDIKTYIDWESAVAEYPEFLANPAQMVTSSRDLRNLIHSGRCVSEARTLDDRSAQVALGFCYVGMLSFLNKLGSDRSTRKARNLLSSTRHR
jgi:hypothetical protein